jgi:hypothetical protein
MLNAALTKRVNGNGGLHPTSSSASLTSEPAVSPMAMGTVKDRDFFFKLAAKPSLADDCFSSISFSEDDLNGLRFVMDTC